MNWLRRIFCRDALAAYRWPEPIELAELDERTFLRLLRSDETLSLCVLASQARRRPNDRTLSRLLRAVSLDEAARIVEGRDICRLSILSEHPDGRVRARTVRTLIEEDSWALQSLLVRANDWVEPIARMASVRSIELFPLVRVDSDLAASAGLVCYLSRCRRWDHSRIVAAYVAEVAQRPFAAETARQITTGRGRAWVYRNLRGRGETEADVLRQALWFGDPPTCLWACDRAASFPELHEVLHDHESPAVRRRALAFAAAAVLEKAVFDPDAGVRNDARHLLGTRDYAAMYRARLPDPGAVSGLGEVGDESDPLRLRPFLNGPDADVRRRALESTFHLIGDRAEADLEIALRDPSRKVQRVAAEALVRSNVVLEPELLASLDLNPNVRWRLLSRAPRWASLNAVLRRLDDLPEAERWIRRWASSRRANVGPRPEEAVEARLLIAESRGRLSPETAAALREAVSYWLV